jgi:hypothetical protein
MATNTKKARGGITKMEAVRRALAELGRDAKPLQLRGWVKEKLGIEMSADHVSVCKGTILRKARGKRKAAVAVPQSSAARNEEPQVHRAPAPRVGISLDDIEMVKGLVGRVEADSLKKLVDVLAG